MSFPSKKVQRKLLDPSDWRSELWCYVVECRRYEYGFEISETAASQWLPWETVPRPNHFRLETNAVRRAEQLALEFKRPMELKLVEFRIEPKYLGYRPSDDERWIV